MPFTVEQFFDVFESYNTAIWPAQVIAYLLGVAAIVLAARETRTRSLVVSAILTLFWVWMGIVYHIIYFAPINPSARLFGALFVVQGLLFCAVGCALGRLRFCFVARPVPIIGAAFMLFALAIYPLIGYASGHFYPRAPIFGVAPCPVTIFTFGLLLWASLPVPIYILIIPFLWSLLGFSAAVSLQVPQDYGLVVAGVLGTALVILRNRRLKRRAESGVAPHGAW
jgi:hypothetical protein